MLRGRVDRTIVEILCEIQHVAYYQFDEVEKNNKPHQNKECEGTWFTPFADFRTSTAKNAKNAKRCHFVNVRSC